MQSLNNLNDGKTCFFPFNFLYVSFIYKCKVIERLQGLIVKHNIGETKMKNKENKELNVGTKVYIIEPSFRAYKIRQGIIRAVPNLDKSAYMVQFNDAARTISAYYRNELYLSKDDAQTVRTETLNNEIIKNQRAIDQYNALIAELQASNEALKRIL